MILISLILVLSAAPSALAHPGRTDANGGHTDRSTGEYHYHHGYPAHQHYDIDGDGSEELIFGQLDVLGGTDVYDIRVTIDEAPMVYGMMIVDVYSIIDGKPFRQDKINLSGGGAYETQILSNGIMKSCRDTPYFPLYSYYKFTDGVGDYVAALIMYRDGTFVYSDKNGDEYISQEEFNRRIAEIEDGAHPVELEWKHLQDYGK